MARVRAKECSNSVYGISFDPPLEDDTPPPVFGAKYNFHLEGAVDCPEFLVHFPTFERLAERHGLMLVSKRRFDRYFNSVSLAQIKNSLKVLFISIYSYFFSGKMIEMEPLC